MYGTQAKSGLFYPDCEFENDVKMYGTQAKPGYAKYIDIV